MKKFTRKYVTKMIATALSLAMLIGLAGCGNQDTQNPDMPEFVYVPTYITLPKGNDNGYTEVMQFTEGKLYYMTNEYDPEAMAYNT